MQENSMTLFFPLMNVLNIELGANEARRLGLELHFNGG